MYSANGITNHSVWRKMISRLLMYSIPGIIKQMSCIKSCHSLKDIFSVNKRKSSANFQYIFNTFLSNLTTEFYRYNNNSIFSFLVWPPSTKSMFLANSSNKILSIVGKLQTVHKSSLLVECYFPIKHTKITLGNRKVSTCRTKII